MEPVGDLLARTHGDLLVSKHKLRRAEGIAMVRQQRETGNQSLCYSTRPFILLRVAGASAAPGPTTLRAPRRKLRLASHGSP